MKWLLKVPYEVIILTLPIAFSQIMLNALLLGEEYKPKVQRRIIFLKQWKSTLKTMKLNKLKVFFI